MLTNPRFSNETGGILLTQADGVDLYVESGDIYTAALEGHFGPVAPFVPPPPPDPADLLEEERANMVASRMQARIALHQAGLLVQIEQAVAQADPVIQIAWQDATVFERNSPTIVALAEPLGLTPEQLDDLFRNAMTIKA